MSKIISPIMRYKYVYLMMAPAFITVFIFSYVPLFGWVIAFKDYTAAKSIWKSRWIGLDNFKLFFSMTGDYVYTIKNTLVMNFGVLFATLFLSFVFAILLNELRSRVFNNTIQITAMFPFFISWGITYSLIYAFFAPVSGGVNQALVGAGIIEQGINVLGDEKYSWILIILSSTWKTLGYNAILFVAAIAGIEREQFESAEIDGAGRFVKIWYILIPHLIPTVVVILILNSGHVFNSDLGQLIMFTNSTNWSTMEVLDMYIYKSGMQKGDFAYATAVGIIKTIISLAMVFAVNYICKKLSDKSIF
ncbi:ABC transporter permease subunit [Paenibacillus eucommiae]|uniref:Aldouronate transport system permease protein n=1 Tax=Paenibacillus eucommiae TaxID=1355755 RepID=A0ABS4J8A5_9BACL|nr:ABC transporter permease subunit [Paenibacillus eucommiae]MBP1996081.1 putative aldouronate transport system permease protein [Paenibacillus eucommiae]